MPRISCLLTGNDNLTIQCGLMLSEAGVEVAAVLTQDERVAGWARKAGFPCFDQGKTRAADLAEPGFDWLLSIANTEIIPTEILALAPKGAINFHDGPLPLYAGLNAPVWAILNGEAEHGITWHLIEGGIDEGDILVTRRFAITEGETALTLNAKCFAAAIESFPEVIAALTDSELKRAPQELADRTYFGLRDRPSGAARIDFSKPASDIIRLVDALDHGDYRNPLAAPKIVTGERIFLVSRAEKAAGSGMPGQVLSAEAEALTIACADGAVRLAHFHDLFGASVTPELTQGEILDLPDGAWSAGADRAIAAVTAAEKGWAARFSDYRPGRTSPPSQKGGDWSRPLAFPDDAETGSVRAAFAAIMSMLSGFEPIDIALAKPGQASPIADWAPVRFDPRGEWGKAARIFAEALSDTTASPGFAADLPARCPDIARRVMPEAAVSEADPVSGAALTLVTRDGQSVLHADLARITAAEAELVANRIAYLVGKLARLDAETPVAALPMLPDSEREVVIEGWNDTETDFRTETCLHQYFEEQAARSPDAVALVFQGQSLTYAELNARANRLAHVLIGMGVGPGQPVGLKVRRSLELVIGALGILKAGGAYLPLDPAYPADRIGLYAEDSGAGVIVSESGLSAPGAAKTLLVDTDLRLADAPVANPDIAVSGTDLAYLIYTSGSTGRPKGVMIEHRNVSNFFTGMDARIRHDPPGVLLAVTSLSFDISVLELFWTLARGFKVVISGEEKLVAGASGDQVPGGMEFSLFYWGNDDGVGRDKYGLLLDGARFADENGFTAIWTPERHFHAFGGLYPNPSVTGAAVAAVTKNIAVRAGSCVAPLHHTARVAEEWAVIDNLTNGRAGIAIASGWQPDDFVLRPENAPPDNKPAMLTAIQDLRKLWAGEPVEYPRADGSMVERLTQPRPVSQELPIWVTTAGNPETWRQAGEIGAHVLTHLLGQSIAEVGEKIVIYHKALQDAGHDPANFKVTLMLHTFLAGDRDTAREIAREPMKNYLRSAADLIRQYAWAFPAFKRPEGVDNARQLDLGSLEPDELEAILDFAFLRYFDQSGLFGTVEDAMARVAEVRAIGVTEIACLIDYGIERNIVLDGLRPLAEVVRRSNMAADYSLAAEMIRHDVTHFQCTPYMARMLLANDEARAALGKVEHLMIGGEPLSQSLIGALGDATGAGVENMYGPTETTIWSTTDSVSPGAPVRIGRPIANTRIYVLDNQSEPCPIGVAGELFIGGAGVARGYWGRDDLTAERFLADPFHAGGRVFRTGDMARWCPDGSLEFLGRNDSQAKIRGYRIEPGEIEAALEADAEVNQAAVRVLEDSSGVGRLVGYITGTAKEAPLRARLTERLPPFMVPQRIMRLEAFPLTPNMKIDRKALPDPDARPVHLPEKPVPAPAPVAAGGEAAALGSEAAIRVVRDVWSRVLNVDAIASGDNFFDIGGHSLLAVEAHRELRAVTGIAALSIADIFRTPTLAGLAGRLETLAAPKRKSGAPVDAEPESASASAVADRRRALRAQRGQVQ